LQSTTRYGTTLDAVFSRFLDTLESKTFISYYSYHKPIVSSISLENRQSITIEPVDENNVDAMYVWLLYCNKIFCIHNKIMT